MKKLVISIFLFIIAISSFASNHGLLIMNQSNSSKLSILWASMPPTNIPITPYGVSRIQERILFTPDGYLLLIDGDPPPPDWQNVNWQYECSMRESYACGRYWLEGETLFLQGNDGSLDKRQWRKEGNLINGGGYYFWPAIPGTPDMKLEGAYIRRPEPYIYGSINDLPFEGGDYYFSRDGRFEIQYPVAGMGIYQLFGFYQVNGTSIILKFDNGAIQAAPFFLWDGKIEVIDINGKHYSLQRGGVK